MIDIHIHHLALDQTQKTFSIYNRMLHENMQLEECILFSAGFHPWYINEDMDEEEMFRQLMNSAKQPNCIMIGESGIDKIKDPSITKQAQIFLQHIQVAEQLEKSLIIHAVKSLEEIISNNENNTCL